MTEQTPDVPDPVIRTREDLADALTARFLANSDAGDDAANDDLVEQFSQWKRRNSQ